MSGILVCEELRDVSGFDVILFESDPKNIESTLDAKTYRLDKFKPPSEVVINHALELLHNSISVEVGGDKFKNKFDLPAPIDTWVMRSYANVKPEYEKLKEIISIILTVSSILEKYKQVDTVCFQGDKFVEAEDLISDLSKSFNINLEFISTPTATRRWSNLISSIRSRSTQIFEFGANCPRRLFFIFKALSYIFRKTKVHKADILFFTRKMFIMIPVGNGKEILSQGFFGYLLHQLRTDYDLAVCIVEPVIPNFDGLEDSDSYFSHFIFSDFNLYLQTIQKAAEILKEYRSLTNTREFKQACYFRGVSLYPQIVNCLNKAFNPFYFTMGLFFVYLRDKIVREIKPKLIVSTIDTLQTKTRSIIELDIPHICLQCGIQSKELWASRWFFNTRKEREEYLPDKLGVTGKVDADDLSDYIPNEIVKVLGQPNHDALLRTEVPEKILDFWKSTISSPKTVLLASKFKDDKMKETIEKVCEEVNNHMEDVQVLIKPHPRELVRPYKKLQKKLDFVLIPQDINIQHIIKLTDAVISILSTVPYEAIILKTPAIIPTYSSDVPQISLVENGLALGVEDLNKWHDALSRALFDEEFRREFLRKRKEILPNYMNIDGNCTDLIKKLIDQMLGAHKIKKH